MPARLSMVYRTYERQQQQNPEWLDLFKRAYSFDIIPESAGKFTASVPEDLEVYHDLGLRMPPTLQQQHCSVALMAVFQRDGPLLKTYRRFSSLPVPLEKALCFETISRPWPDSGILGEMLIMRDQIFSSTITMQLLSPLTMQRSGKYLRGVENDTNNEPTLDPIPSLLY